MKHGKRSADGLNQMARGYQAACVLVAAAELNLCGTLAGRLFTAAEAARKLGADRRGVEVLLDALTALQLITKKKGRYEIPAGLAGLMTGTPRGNQLAMLQHQANCLRRWGQLAAVVKSGRLPPREPSIRGAAGDLASFVEAMDNVSGPVSGKLVAALQPLKFRHLLDVGGATGTWTIAFLRTHPAAQATLFDLPQVIPQARERLARAGLGRRVTLAPGNFYVDPLPRGADLAWVSAIVHQNSREQNRRLFAQVFKALEKGGQILIRDILMDASHTAPVAGALFAVNMLVATERGGTFTFEELRDDLAAAGFIRAKVLRRDEGMHSVVSARKP